MAKSTSDNRKIKRAIDQRYERLKNKRKMVMVAIDPNMLGSILINGTKAGVEATGLPKDAVQLGFNYDMTRMTMIYIFGHEDFIPVKEGVAVPLIEVEFKQRG